MGLEWPHAVALLGGAHAGPRPLGGGLLPRPAHRGERPRARQFYLWASGRAFDDLILFGGEPFCSADVDAVRLRKDSFRASLRSARAVLWASRNQNAQQQEGPGLRQGILPGAGGPCHLRIDTRRHHRYHVTFVLAQFLVFA